MITIFLISTLLFFVSYIISVTFTSVFYHRALCHRALTLHPMLEKFVMNWGFVITAVDPAIWTCTHRLHHIHADSELDPHSPVYKPSVLAIHKAHMQIYAEVNCELQKPDSKFRPLIKDFPFALHPLMRLPIVPWVNVSIGNGLVYLLHLAFYILVYQLTGHWTYAIAIAAGLLGHPVQGVLVNYFGHKRGYRNFETADASTNHRLVAWLIFGEGYQNNHHDSPARVNFAVRPGEFDFGYLVCLFLRKLSLVSF